MHLLLQDSRVDPTVNNCYCIAYAMCNNLLEIVKLLLQHPKVVAYTWKKKVITPLLSICQGRGYREIEELISQFLQTK